MHIKTSPVCNKKKDPTKKQTAPLMDYRSGYPLDRIGLDIIGPLPQTKRRNKYLLVVGDYFTCWMEACPFPQQNAEMIADKLVNEFISRFGVPLEVHTDQGRNIYGKFFAEICKLLETTKTRTTAYHPASNGMIERFNRTLGSMIKSFVNANASNWDLYVNLLLAAYRSNPHPATGFTQNCMMLGREINIPKNILLSECSTKEPADTDDYVKNLGTKMNEVFNPTRDNLKIYGERQKRDHDTRVFEHKYQVGSLVFKFDKAINKKFRSPWVGPYTITKIINPVVYEITKRNIKEIIHFDRLKPCNSDDTEN